jgi:hypothetical protein
MRLVHPFARDQLTHDSVFCVPTGFVLPRDKTNHLKLSPQLTERMRFKSRKIKSGESLLVEASVMWPNSLAAVLLMAEAK